MSGASSPHDRLSLAIAAAMTADVNGATRAVRKMLWALAELHAREVDLMRLKADVTPFVRTESRR